MEKKLPKNWVSVSLQDVTKNVKGKKPQIQSENEFEGSIPYMDIKALEYNIIRQFADIESSKLFEEGDVAMVWDGARSGWVSKTNFGAIGSTIVAFKPIKLNSNYLFYYLFEKYPFINSNTRGVGIPHVDPTILWDLKFPLAPLPEQNRIVNKLDRLFAQLETIKTSMANIPLLLKDFRQQVLTQAVTGALTADTNKTSVSLASTITIGNLFEEAPANWKWVKLIDIAKLESGHTPRKSEEEYWINGNVPWISLQDIRAAHGKIIEKTKYMPNELGIKKSSARLLPQGTVCFCRDISVGYTTVMGKEMATTQHFANWVCGDSLNNMFLLYAFMASKDYLTSFGKGTTVGTIYMPALKELRILLPPINEQQQIVSRVENLFAKADTIEEQYKTLKAKIDALPQAILHKAFKGELSKQLDSDGDARDLLKEISSLKELVVKRKSKSSINKRKENAKTDTLNPPQGKINNQKTPISSRIEQIIKTKTFNIVQDNFNNKSFHFTEIIEMSKLEYEQIKTDIQETLELTKLGMRPGLIEKYINKKEGIKLKWLDK